MSTIASPVQRRYRSPSRDACAEVSLSEFSDSEIRAEYEHRNNVVLGLVLGIEDDPVEVSGTALRNIRALLLSGRSSEAAWAMQDFIRDALGTAL